MEIQVKNLGTIKEGVVDLSKNLIIFAGQNNTGKSYMAYLIYGLCKNAMEINENVANEAIFKSIFASKTITPVVKITATEPSFLSSYIFFRLNALPSICLQKR